MLTVIKELEMYKLPCGRKVRRFLFQCDCGKKTEAFQLNDGRPMNFIERV